MITIVLIDDDAREKDEIASHISGQEDIEIRGMGKDYYDAIKLVKKFKPDIALLDAALGFSEGDQISYTLKQYSPGTAIVMICSSIKDSFIQGMVKGMITGFLVKDHDMNHLAIILRKVYKGEYYLNSQTTARVFQILGGYLQNKTYFQREAAAIKASAGNKENRPPGFSIAELKVLHHIADGYVSKEIAKLLNLKDGTVRNYISSIIHKTGLKTRTEVALYAIQHGFGNKSLSELR